LYEEYYSRQNGGEIPVFADRRFQRGHGLGSILGGFVKRIVLPFFRNVAKSMLKNAAKTGGEVASDLTDGRSLLDSVKDRVQKEVSKKLRFSLHLQGDEDRRQEDIDVDVTSLRNGIRSRTVVRIYGAPIMLWPIIGRPTIGAK